MNNIDRRYPRTSVGCSLAVFLIILTMRSLASSALLAARRARPGTSSSLLSRRLLSYSVINVPKCNIYRFGDGQRATPALSDVQWTVNEGESWVITGPQRNGVVEVRFHTPPQSTSQATLPCDLDAPRSHPCHSTSSRRPLPLPNGNSAQPA